MVLQRDRVTPIWGWDTPGTLVTVTFDAGRYTATTNANGRWQLALSPHHAGGPFRITIADDHTTLAVFGVLVGEVWLCTGQANMVMPVADGMHAWEELAKSNYPQIHIFTVKPVVAETPCLDLEGQWSPCDYDVVGRTSALAYFFGRELYRTLDIPIGLIQTTWAGAPAEAWVSQPALATKPELAPLLARIIPPNADRTALQKEYTRQYAQWVQTGGFLLDPGNTGKAAGWADPDIDTQAWTTMPVPGYWETQHPPLNIDGAVWFRTTVDIPPAWSGKDLTLHLGPIDDYDVTYWNGEQIGATGPEQGHTSIIPRNYPIPNALVKAGKSTLAVRIFDHGGNGGFCGRREDLTLGVKAEKGASIHLAGDWLYRIEYARNPDAPRLPPVEPLPPGHPWRPAGLYQGMIAPLLPYALRGVICCQGEANVTRAAQYRTLFPLWIQSWREAWHDAAFPFYFVQLPNYGASLPAPGESAWAELREAQAQALRLQHTGMAVTIDLGETNTLLFPNKQEAARRLALQVLANVYGQPIGETQGPSYQEMRIEGKTVRITFTHATGLTARTRRKLTGFTIAGTDHRFYPAQAKIDGETVLVWCDSVTTPAAVRYGWAMNPSCTLMNGAGLPAAPFRTDAWPGVTE